MMCDRKHVIISDIYFRHMTSAGNQRTGCMVKIMIMAKGEKKGLGLFLFLHSLSTPLPNETLDAGRRGASARPGFFLAAALSP